MNYEVIFINIDNPFPY